MNEAIEKALTALEDAGAIVEQLKDPDLKDSIRFLVIVQVDESR